MKRRRLAIFRGDRSLWIIIAVLCVVSLLVVYSSTASMAYREVGGDTSYYLLRQMRFIILGFVAIFIVHWIDIRHYIRFAPLFFKISVGLMILAYVVGVSMNDATRWIRIPLLGLTFQPSDLIKITLAMTLATALGTRQGVIDRLPILPSLTFGGWRRNPQRNMDIYLNTTQPIVIPILLASAVIFPSNFSTAAIIFVVSMIVLLVGRVRVREIWRLTSTVFIVVVVLVLVMNFAGIGRASTWIARVENFAAPIVGIERVRQGGNVDFQEQQAKIAIASGGTFGKGPGNSTQRSQLPHPYSDFAYAFIIEEYGLFGGVLIMALYLWIFYRAGVIMKRCQRPVSALVVLGLSLMISFSAFVHIVVSVGLMPVTGQALPIISLGGSSVLFTCIALGVILSISRESDAEEQQARQAMLEEQNRRDIVQERPRQENDEPEVQQMRIREAGSLINKVELYESDN